MAQTSNDLPLLEQAIHEVTSGLAEMGRDGELSTPVGDWTAHEHLAHASLAQSYFARWVSGDLVPYAGNEAVRPSLSQRSGSELAEQIVKNTDEFVAAWHANLSETRPHPGLGMLPLTGREWGSYSLFHLLEHACSMDHVLGHAPVLRPAHVPLTLPFLWVGMPAVANPQVAGRLAGLLVIDLGPAAPRFGIRVADGDLTIEQGPSADVDCVLSTDPATFFRVSIGDLSQTDAMRSGRLRVAGTRPELGVAYEELFITP